MYEKYLSMQSAPAGKILETILKNKQTMKFTADSIMTY